MEQALTKDEKKAIVLRMSTDYEFFCTALLSKFTAPFTSIHKDIMSVLFDDNIEKKLMLAPRGIGKSTLMEAKIIHSILFRKKRFIVYVTTNQIEAIRQMQNVKTELLTNTRIRDLFGDIKINDNPDIDDDFSKTSWVAFGYTLVVPMGCDQPMRGKNWKGFRPDLVCLDDMTVVKELQNELTRNGTFRWVLSDVCECYDKIRKNFEICYLDTIKHFDDVPMRLIKMGTWKVVNRPVCDAEFNSLAPDFMTTEKIKELMDSLRQVGELDLFYREYMNIPRDPDKATFMPKDFRYFDNDGKRYDYHGDIIQGKIDFNKLEKVILVDPAKTVNPSSDFSVSTVVGIDIENRAVYRLDVFSDRCQPDQLYNAIIEQIKHYNIYVVGLEVTSLNLFITHPFENELKARGLNYIEVIELKASSKKELRIAALSPMIRRGYVYFKQGQSERLEEQLLTHGFSEYDDEADSLAYVVPMMAMGGKYFIPERDPILELTQKEYDMLEAEYAELDNEQPLEWEYAV